jgi:geranylgeranyl pyrophosphate synthase
MNYDDCMAAGTHTVADRGAAGSTHPSFVVGVEDRLAAVVAGEARLERGAARLLLASGAKRARAQVCRSLGGAFDIPAEVARELAVVVELIHGASLLHDDVVDHSDRRRGVPTVNATDGNAFAVLCGDLVLAKALSLLASVPGGPVMLGDALEVIERMTRAAVIEVEVRTTLPPTEGATGVWREMALGKTGALFGLCGTLVGRAANVDDGVRASLRHSLESVGLAFQLMDDLADVTGADVGKPRGQDLREHALNHTVLHAMAHSAEVAAAVDRYWHGDGAGVVDEAGFNALCDAVVAAGARQTVDEARAAVQDGAGSQAALEREILPWARTLVETSTRHVQTHGHWPGGQDEGLPTFVDAPR